LHWDVKEKMFYIDFFSSVTLEQIKNPKLQKKEKKKKEIGSQYIVQTGLKLIAQVILLPQSPKYLKL
jgi:hypothetical protein